jgi:CRP/FNR family cyclic AMP-dependent transcriptional regulator
MTERSLADALRETWFGADLAPETATRLAACAYLQVLPAGRELFHEGSESRELGVLRSGRIALRVHVPERGQVTILTVETGDIVGWSAIVPPYRATSTGIALEEVEVLVFDGPSLRELLADPALAAAFYPRVLQAVARRLNATRVQLLDLFGPERTEPW